METKAEKFNKVYGYFKDRFTSGFHNVLWQIMMNDLYGGMMVVFTPGNHEQLGVVMANQNEKGFIPTYAFFADSDWEKINELVEDLNKEVFDVDVRTAFKIQLQSM